MLVLSRKANETVRLIVTPEYGAPITIFVHTVDLRGDILRCGFTAPDNVRIIRDEIAGREEHTRVPNPYLPPALEELNKQQSQRRAAKRQRRLGR